MIRRACWSLLAAALAWGSPGARAQQEEQAIAGSETSCTICHADTEIVEPVSLEIVRDFAGDVHAAAGISCHDCHGGNPDLSLVDDPYAAMDESFGPNPYTGTFPRAEIPMSCARCHSDPVYMRRFRPDLRVDQLDEYATSQHGQALAAGNDQAATCVDCHGAHGIQPAEDPRSSVHPLRVAETCSTCHSDEDRMATALLVDAPISVRQTALWTTSVHAMALEKGDLSAPTCNDCHGNHGAAPPGMDSLAFVCGQCHGREAELFRSSTKRALFQEHNVYLEEAEGAGCLACHEESEPQAELTDFVHFGECSSCHGHHAVTRPTVALLSPLPESPCAFCHETPPGLEEEWEPAASREGYLEARSALLAALPSSLDAGQRFDWMVDRALELEAHTRPASAGQGAAEQGALALQPEFERLFQKFRIGKTGYDFDDPVTGRVERRPLRGCSACHAPEPLLGEPDGAQMSQGLLNRVWELSAVTARAERVLLSARRGGVETGAVGVEIDQAVDSQIQLAALVHGFTLDEGSEIVKTHQEGMESARRALALGREALDELSFRRRGLVISLAFVLFVLIALGLKIRQIDAH